MNKSIGITLGVIVILVIGYSVLSTDKAEKKEMVKDDNGTEVVEKNEGAMMKKDGEIMTDNGAQDTVVKDEQAMVKAGSYVAYSAEKIAMAETGDVVLFFHASWCPSCKALNGDIEKNVSAIPAGVTILKTDYDKEVELKKKYGVTTQHTLVQVDKDGNLIKKWSGGSKLENLLSQIQ